MSRSPASFVPLAIRSGTEAPHHQSRSSGQKESRDSGSGSVVGLDAHVPGDMPRVRLASMLYSRLKRGKRGDDAGNVGWFQNTSVTRVGRARRLSRACPQKFAAVKYTVSEGDGAVKLAVVRSGALDEEVG